jgi:hypothetical protein
MPFEPLQGRRAIDYTDTTMIAAALVLRRNH